MYRTEALALSRDSRKLARMTDIDVIHIFDVGTRRMLSQIEMASRPTSVSMSWDSEHMLVKTLEGKVHLLHIDTQTFVKAYEGPPAGMEYITRAVFGGPRDEFVLSAAEGMTSLFQSLAAK